MSDQKLIEAVARAIRIGTSYKPRAKRFSEDTAQAVLSAITEAGYEIRERPTPPEDAG